MIFYVLSYSLTALLVGRKGVWGVRGVHGVLPIPFSREIILISYLGQVLVLMLIIVIFVPPFSDHMPINEVVKRWFILALIVNIGKAFTCEKKTSSTLFPIKFCKKSGL